MSKPKILQVETTSFCNSHCVFCWHDMMADFGMMSSALYVDIVKQAKYFDLDGFIPMMTGEPFLDPLIIERVEFARQMLPKTGIRLFTNGSLINEDHIKALSKIRGFDVWVSLNGNCAQTRQDLMGLSDFEAVRDKIHLMENAGINVKAYMVLVPTTSLDEAKDFQSEFKQGIIGRYNNFAGLIYRYNRPPNRPCERAMHSMTICWDGTVNLCCFDPTARVNFGNAKDNTLEEIWNSPRRQGYVENHAKGKGNQMALCEHCTEL